MDKPFLIFTSAMLALAFFGGFFLSDIAQRLGGGTPGFNPSGTILPEDGSSVPYDDIIRQIIDRLREGKDISDLLAAAYNTTDYNQTMTFCVNLCTRCQEGNLSVHSECSVECNRAYYAGGMDGLNYLIRYNLGLAG